MTGSLADLLHDQLRDLYDAEAQYGRLLPKMIKRASHAAIRDHLISTEDQTHENLGILARVCSLRGICPDGVPCEAMNGLIRELRRHASEPATLDAAIIANAQRITHYEIAGFGTASFFAQFINASEASSLLAALADAASARDQALTRIALSGWHSPRVHHGLLERERSPAALRINGQIPSTLAQQAVSSRWRPACCEPLTSPQ